LNEHLPLLDLLLSLCFLLCKGMPRVENKSYEKHGMQSCSCYSLHDDTS